LSASASAASAPVLPIPADDCSTSAATAAAWASMPLRMLSRVAVVRSSSASSEPEKLPSASLTFCAAELPALSISASRAASRSVASPMIRSASVARLVRLPTCSPN